jgi:hypothetical protein
MATTTQAIQEIYIGLLGRAADAGGLAYWAAEIDGGTLTLEQLRANIVNEQPEYAAGLGTKTRAQVVEALYQRLFERSAEAEGLEYWVNGGGSTVNVDQLVLALSAGASAADRLVLDNKVEAAIYYTANTSDANYTADAATAAVNSVDGTAESVEASKSATDDNSQTSGDTFTLTTGVDVLQGTASNDTFIGLFADDSSDTFTLGDEINGAAGTDTLRIINDDANGLSLSGKTISNVENLVVINADDNFNEMNVSNVAFDNLTIDLSDMDDNYNENLNVNNINADTTLTVEGIQADDAEFDVNAFFSTSDSAAGSTSVIFQDMDINELDTEIDANFTAASTYEFNLTTSNIESDDNFNVNANIDLGAADLDLAINVDVTDVVGEDVNFYLDFNTNGNVQATAVVNITDSNVNDFEIDIDNNGNGTSANDMLTINLDGLNNGVSDENANLDLDANYFETIAINVSKDAVFGDINFYDTEGNDIDVTIDVDANATFTIDGDLNMNGNVGNQTLTIMGAGNVDLGDLDFNNNANTTATLDASALTGNLTVVDSNAGIDTLTSGSGDDTITLATFATVVDAGDGDDFVDMNGLDYGDANAATIDGGDGTDTIAIDDGALLDAATAANISNFEILDISGGTGSYDLEEETSLKNVSATGSLVAAATIANAGSDVALTLNAFVDVDAITMSQLDGTGTSDSLELNLNAADTDTDQTAEGESDAVIIAAEYETVALASNATTASEDSAPGAGDALTAADYTNTADIDAADMETLTISGNAMATVTFTDAAALTLIDASSNEAGVDVDGSTGAAVSGLTFSGSAAADTYTASANGDLVQANGGADTVTLGGGDDTVRFAAASDSQLTLTDTSDPADDVADTATGFDVVTGFGLSGTDVIELSSLLSLATGDARTDMLQKGDFNAADVPYTAALLQAAIGDGVGFFDTGVVDRATAFLSYDAVTAANDTGFLFVDANGDGDFTEADDIVIELAGVTSLAITDIQFG